MQVDPDNRLVADALEAEWSARLRALDAAQEDYEKQRASDTLVVDDQRHAQLLALCTDFPTMWRNPKDVDAKSQARRAPADRRRDADPS